MDIKDNLQITGSVFIVHALLQHAAGSSNIASIKSEDVVTYLQRFLHWRLTKFLGTEMPR
jgi:hypothetical protein